MDYFAKISDPNPLKPARSGFDLSHSRKQTQGIGKLCPSMVMEVVPGDHIKLGSQVTANTQAMFTPLYHNVDIRTEYFYVPYRILSDNWENFYKDPRTSTLLPNITLQSFVNMLSSHPDYATFGSLSDYLGLPTSRFDTIFAHSGTVANDPVVNLFPFLAYQLIYHDWYQYKRLDEYQYFEEDILPQLRQLTSVSINSAQDVTPLLANLLTLRNRIWSRDYFTEATREPQAGDPVQFPFSGSAPVTGTTADFDADGAVVNTLLRDVRCAIDIQDWLERQNLAGFDYRETIWQHFGVWNNDGRLQKPEFIGRHTQQFINTSVVSNADTDSANLGEQAGRGYSSDYGNVGDYNVTEHGLIMAITSIVPQSGYFQGVPPLWSRLRPLDFYSPEFQNMGDQPIPEQQIYLCETDQPVDNEYIFGYNARYGEYKQIPDSVAGFFAADMNTWHLARHFTAPPALSEKFEEIRAEHDGLNRNFPVVTDNSKMNIHNYMLEIWHSVNSVRPMQYVEAPHVVKL